MIKPSFQTLSRSTLPTPLGEMVVLADEEELYLLAFADFPKLEKMVEKLKKYKKSTVIEDKTQPMLSIEAELKAYFAGKLKVFETPFALCGTPFQRQVWRQLVQVPYGRTRSYAQQAETLGKASAYRAVANANGSNLLSIIVPCHRIISHDGTLGGYGGGLGRKQALLALEGVKISKQA